MQDANILDAVDEIRPPSIQSLGETHFEIEPLQRGYGVTLGNSLRRVLLSSIEGAAVTHIQIDGVVHEFSTIPGIQEDTTEIILNLKKLRLRTENSSEQHLRIEAQGVGVVTAGDIIDNSETEILNPDLVIAHLTDEKSRLSMDLWASRGKGYVIAEKQVLHEQTIGVIPIDSIFSPVISVKYEVQDTRVGQRTDFDRLVLDVVTDGSISACQAIAAAAKLLQSQLKIFTGLQDAGDGLPVDGAVPDGQDIVYIENLDLSVRSLNCLKRAGIVQLEELLGKTEEELMKLKNFGQKSLDEITERLRERGYGLRPGTADDKLKERAD